MDLQYVKNWLQSGTGTTVFVGALSVLALGALYSMFFAPPGALEKKGLNEKAGITVMARDTVFKERKGIYFQSQRRERKKISSDADFFSFKADIDKLKSIADSALATKNKSPIKPQKIADSTVSANRKILKYISSYQPRGERRTLAKSKPSIDIWAEATDKAMAAFFTHTAVESPPKTDEKILAYVHSDQKVHDKARVVLRLAETYNINGKTYKRNTRIYATAKFSTNRVILNISNVQNDPVRLTAYDRVDGERGVYVEGESFIGEAASEATRDAIDQVDVNGIPIGSALKRIFKRRAHAASVYLLNNYQVYLKPL